MNTDDILIDCLVANITPVHKKGDLHVHLA